jgi:hypothetical protein
MVRPNLEEKVNSTKKISALALFAFCVAGLLGSLKANADTVSLKLTGTANDGNVYPYYFSVDGSKTSTSLMCISFNEEVSDGESWTATIDPLSASSSTQDKEATWLFNDANTHPSDAVSDQYAAWFLFEPTFGDWVGDNSQLDAAKSFVQNNPNSSLYSEFELYVPVKGSQPWFDGTPQTFIGDAPPAATPEPSSLMLLGTGLLTAAGVISRKRRLV